MTINGIFTDETGARNNSKALQSILPKIHNDEKLVIDYLPNASHLGGLGDILESVYQGLFDSEIVEDHDLIDMLTSASEKVETQKLLLVAHSQGNFYANSFYDTVADKVGGVPHESIGVYSVATPSGRVAGGGTWLTSDTDKVIAGVVGRVLSRKIMTPNTHIALQLGDDSLGHNFSSVYLKYRGAEIVADIKSSLDQLQTNGAQDTQAPCLAPPKLTLGYKIMGLGLAIGDPVMDTAVKAGQNIYAVITEGALATYDVALAAAGAAQYAINSVVGSAKGIFTAVISQNFGTGSISTGGLSASILNVLPANTPEATQEQTAPLQPVVVRLGSPQAADQTSAPIVPATTVSQDETSHSNQPVEYATANDLPQISSTTQITTSQSQNTSSGGGAAPVGGTSESPPAVSLLNPPQANQPSTPTISSSSVPQIPSIQNFQAKFSTSTLNIDLSWLSLNTQSTSTSFVVKNTTNGSSSTVTETSSTATIFVPLDFGQNYDFSIQAFDSLGATSTDVWQTISSITTTTADVLSYSLNVQPINLDASIGSWYSGNWYQLGIGFYGTVYALAVEGHINDTDFLASHLTLKEFLDANYTKLNQSFTISDNAPFIAANKKIAITDLNIPLQPNKYYRLDTYQDFQNKSVILKGTTATGTAMWDEFISGTGGVSHTYSFYPSMQMIMAKNSPLISPPSPPANFSASFDSFNSVLNVSWSSSTDPDTLDNLLSYQLNHSTSSVFDSNSWVSTSSPTTISIISPNSYTLGVMAMDDFGNTSTPAIVNWSFPDGFVPLPSQLDYSYQSAGGKQQIVINATTTIDAVAMWLGGTGGTYCCSQSYLRIFTEPGDLVAASDDLSLYAGEIRETMYHFLSPVTLSPGQYRLIPTKGPGNNTNGTWIFGSLNDAYQGGTWIDGNDNDTGKDMYFRLRSVP